MLLWDIVQTSRRLVRIATTSRVVNKELTLEALVKV